MSTVSSTGSNAFLDKLTGSSSAAKAVSDGATTAKEASERFLKLLVTQLQNQDPMNPVDNAQMTSQMAQISTVSGIEKLNTTVAGLNSQFVQMQALQGASLVGRDVIVPGNQLDPNTAQTPGMDRKAAINFARVGAQKLWAGTVSIKPDAKTGAHHHGHLESIIYVVKGKARMRWGEHLQFTAEAGPGDFIYVPPFVPHQEINASRDEVLECVLVRSDGEAVAVNLDIEPAEPPENVAWVDPTHPTGGV